MKTVGELLIKARESQNITINQLSRVTKIDPEHIKNLENNRYDKLPPPTFIKGFIRNIATVLNQNPDDLVAVFRRDYLSPKPTLTTIPVKNKSKKKLQINSQLSLIVLGCLVFTIYLGFQLRAYLVPPKLEISQPLPKAVVVSPLVVEGITSSGSVIQINKNNPLEPDSSGYFITNISLPPMETELEITSTNRFGRTSKKTIPITIISQ
ncbi:helix-turn-helix domain-containing protein [Patescibacteria group bacterium]|nr:helix-turn-helix domain-containing protein [Patescibacteria group bacterium]